MIKSDRIDFINLDKGYSVDKSYYIASESGVSTRFHNNNNGSCSLLLYENQKVKTLLINRLNKIEEYESELPSKVLSCFLFGGALVISTQSGDIAVYLIPFNISMATYYLPNDSIADLLEPLPDYIPKTFCFAGVISEPNGKKLVIFKLENVNDMPIITEIKSLRLGSVNINTIKYRVINNQRIVFIAANSKTTFYVVDISKGKLLFDSKLTAEVIDIRFHRNDYAIISTAKEIFLYKLISVVD